MPKAIHSLIIDRNSALIYYLIYLCDLIFDIASRHSRGPDSKISRRSSVTHTMAPKKSPIWAFLEVVGAVAVGNQKSKCEGCGKVATQSPQQWWSHYDECTGALDAAITEAAKTKAAEFFQDKRDQERREAQVSKIQTKIPALTQKQLFEKADQAIGRWAFATGQPLRAVDDYYLREAFKAVAEAGPNRKQLTRKRLKDELLPAEKSRLKRRQIELIGNEPKLFGRCTVSDGWTDATEKPILNILLVSPSGDEFVEAIDTSGSKKTMQYIANAMGKHVTADVDFVVVDGACKGAIEILMSKHPHLSGVVCTTHSLDLFMEDLGKVHFAADQLAAARDIVHFINNHHATRAMFAKLSDVKLIAPSTTRFDYHLMMVKRLLRCENQLRSLVSSAEWRDFRNSQQKQDVKAHAS